MGVRHELHDPANNDDSSSNEVARRIRRSLSNGCTPAQSGHFHSALTHEHGHTPPCRLTFERTPFRLCPEPRNEELHEPLRSTSADRSEGSALRRDFPGLFFYCRSAIFDGSTSCRVDLATNTFPLEQGHRYSGMEREILDWVPSVSERSLRVDLVRGELREMAATLFG